jgi:hypothetical protein
MLFIFFYFTILGSPLFKTNNSRFLLLFFNGKIILHKPFVVEVSVVEVFLVVVVDVDVEVVDVDVVVVDVDVAFVEVFLVVVVDVVVKPIPP